MKPITKTTERALQRFMANVAGGNGEMVYKTLQLAIDASPVKSCGFLFWKVTVDGLQSCRQAVAELGHLMNGREACRHYQPSYLGALIDQLIDSQDTQAHMAFFKGILEHYELWEEEVSGATTRAGMVYLKAKIEQMNSNSPSFFR